MTKIILCCSLLFLSACAGSDSSSAPQKSIFSLWTTADQSLSVNLAGGSFNSPIPLTLTFNSGEKCTVKLTLNGNEESGNHTIADAAYVSGTGAGSDPGCADLNEVGTYQRTGVTLKFCTNAGQCTNYY